MATTYANCLVHCVFATKGRRPLIAADMRRRLWAYLGGIARAGGMTALAVGGTTNHVHVLLVVPPTLSVARAVQHLKGGSSKWVHDTFPNRRGFAWQEGYGAFTIGVAGTAATKRYIETQVVQHRRRSFEAEWIAFLDRHGVPYDARYVFG
jgi:REP element-mobilizing transposase RayT